MGEINSAKNGITKTMGDLARVQEEADKKLELVRAVSTDDAKKVKSSGDVLSPKVREMVRTLKRQGWNKKEIASKLKMSEGEVELILEIPE
jgi:DNA-directed RNA polymerase specialized sigma24 family protein